MAESRGDSTEITDGEGPASDAVFVIDELVLRNGQLDAFLSAFASDYRPGAEARGQRLLHLLVSPPTRALELPQTVTLLWQLDGVAGFWGMRSQNAADDVVAFWAECDARWVESRTRRFASAPESLSAFDAAGRANG